MPRLRPTTTALLITVVLIATAGHAPGQVSGERLIPARPTTPVGPHVPAPAVGVPAERIDRDDVPPAGRSGDAPAAIPDAYVVAAGDVLTIPAANGLLLNDFDPENDPLTAQSYTPGNHGSVFLTTDGAFTYTPDAGYTGEDDFLYSISDGTSVSAFGSVTLTVLPADNRPPLAVADHHAVAGDQTLDVPAPIGLLSNDIDADADEVMVTAYSAPANGTLVVDVAGAFTYQPDPGFEGIETLTYFISDGLDIGEGELVITVTPATNRAPTPADDWYYTPTDVALDVDGLERVLRNDRDPDGDGIEVVSYFVAANGTLAMAADGSFTYTPDPGYSGEDVAGYTMRDDQGNLATRIAELRLIVGIYGGIATGAITPPSASGFGLRPASPNPFNPRTELAYGLEQPGHVALRVLDMRGRVVATLVDAPQPAGEHLAVWDGRTEDGGRASSGTYVAELRGGGKRSVQKLTLVK
jgi:VCBS repeat-containing protein